MKDRLIMDQILSLDAKALLHVVRKHSISICGVFPAAVVLVAAKNLGATNAKRMAYQTSGGELGDSTRVVGYAGICLQ